MAFRDGDTLEIKRLSSPVIFDGRCNDTAWAGLSPLPMQMYQPVHGDSCSEEAEIYVAFDNEYFYLAGRLHYKNGAKIIATSKKRDAFDPGNDFLGILFDSFNDNENAVCFMTNPEGIRTDFSLANDGVPPIQGMPFNQSWNTFWDVKTRRTDNLWEVEIRIPLSSLRFQDHDNKVVMGLTVYRFISSRQEPDLYPLISNELGSFSPWKPSQAKKVILKGLSRKNPVYITPYVLGGFEETHDLIENGTSYMKNDRFRHTAGLDLKYSLTSNLTVDMTLNTDFAQVESDDEMINLTRYDLFYPEKRQFFLERSSLFDIKTGLFDQLFYSRRIGMYEGELVPIYGGIRTVGRIGKWDLGLLDMQTSSIMYHDKDADSTYRVEAANSGILRLRRQVINPRSYVGGVLTSKMDVKGNYNYNGGFDGTFNLFGNDYLSLNYTQTFDNREPSGSHPWDYGKYFLSWEKRSDVGFYYNASLSRRGGYNNPELGFEMFDDYTSAFAQVSYGWVNNDAARKILKNGFFFWNWTQIRNSDHRTDVSWFTPGWYFESKKGYMGQFYVFYRYENPVDTFSLSDLAYFPPGFYRFGLMEGRLSTPENKLFSLMTMFDLGSYYDGYILSLGPAKITARPSSGLQLSLDYQYSLINIPARNQHFETHLARLKTEVTFTTKWSLLLFLQYSSEDNFGINNIRLRYNPREGNDLYLVYNEGYNSYRKREFPPLPLSDNRSILLKYTYTFQF